MSTVPGFRSFSDRDTQCGADPDYPLDPATQQYVASLTDADWAAMELEPPTHPDPDHPDPGHLDPGLLLDADYWLRAMGFAALADQLDTLFKPPTTPATNT